MSPRKFEINDIVIYLGIKYRISDKWERDGVYMVTLADASSKPGAIAIMPKYAQEADVEHVAITSTDAQEQVETVTDYTKIENIRIGMPFWYDGKRHEVNNMRRLETAPGKFLSQVSSKDLMLFVEIKDVSFVQKKTKKTFYFITYHDEVDAEDGVRDSSCLYENKEEASGLYKEFLLAGTYSDIQFHEIELEVEA